MDNFGSLFKKCAENYPNANAIRYCDNNGTIESLHYEQLANISGDISKFLLKYVDKYSLVGIAIEPNLILTSLIVGLQVYESPFYCIDVTLSETDLLKIVEQIKLKYILCTNDDKCFREKFQKLGKRVDKLQIADSAVELWILDKYEPLSNINLSYVIRTSGTTGTEKLIQVTHDCIMPNINNLRNIFNVTPDDIIYFGTPITFDPFIIELYLALTSGACLLTVSKQIKLNHELLFNTLFPSDSNVHHGVTLIQLPPSTLLCFPEESINKMLSGETSLKILALGGEQFPEQILKYERHSDLRIFNLYGITEVSCWAAIKEIYGTDTEITLGMPLSDTILEVRNTKGNVLHEGEGEMFIGSETRICKIDDEIISDNVVFRPTGDLVLVKDNEYFYIERTDNIIKRFGNRVSLLEIEKLVYFNTDLNSVCVWDDVNSKLMLFIILKEHDVIVKKKILDKLRIKLLTCLPKEGNPDIIELIPSIPLTKNGKADRKLLQRLIISQTAPPPNVKPTEILQNIFSKYFGLSYYELEERKDFTFHEIGGNSILAIQISSEFNSYFEKPSKILLTMLLVNKTYHECMNELQNWIESKLKLKRMTTFEEKPEKRMKVIKNEEVITCAIKWRQDLGACVDSSPVVFTHEKLGNLVAIGSHSKTFTVFDMAGRLVSQVVLPDGVEGSACISPCNHFAMFGCNDGYIYCVDVQSGAIVWSYFTDSSIKSTPAVCSNKKNIVFGSYDKAVHCIAISGGSQVWKTFVREGIKSNAIIHNKRVYVATLQRTRICLDEENGSILWKNKSLQPVFGSPCMINDGQAVMWGDVNGNICCFNSENGYNLWTYKVGGCIYSSLINYQNTVVLGCYDHHIYHLGFDAPECKELVKINVESQVTGTPCVLVREDKLYFVAAGKKGHIRIYDSKGGLVQQVVLPGEIFSSPTIKDDKLFIGCRDNNLYCISLEFKD